MNEQSSNQPSNGSFLGELQNSKKQLCKATKDEQKFASLLQSIQSQLSQINVDKITGMQTFLYDILKPFTRQITNFDPKQLGTLKLMKSVILKIIELYCTIFVKYQHVGSLQIIKQLIMRQNFLFVNSIHRAGAAAAAPGKVPSAINKDSLMKKDEQDLQAKTYKWSKGRLGYTQFHKECCEVVFEIFYPLPDALQTMKLCTAKQLMSFMYFLEDYICDEEMYKFAIRSYESLKKIAFKPSKDHVKQATKQVFEQISQKISRMLYYHQDRQLKKQVALLGPNFAINVLEKQPAIQNKLHGLRILQKFAYQYFYRNTDLIKDQFFGQWLVEHNLWQLLISKTSDWTMIHSSEYILKFIVNKGKISVEKFEVFLDLIWEVNEQKRRFYIKSIDALKLSFSFMNMVLANFRKIRENADIYVEDFFYLIESLARYGSDSQRRQCIDIMLTVIKTHYMVWVYRLQRKSLDSFKYCFQKLTDSTKQLAERTQMYIEIINEFISDPNYLTLSISRIIFESEQKKSSYAIQKAAKNLVQQRKIIQTIINLMSQQVSYKEELIYFLKAILLKYRNYNMSASLSFPEKVLLQATAYPQIFSELICFCNSETCQKLMKKLLKIAYQTEVGFQCIKQLFYKTNSIFIETIEPQYFRNRQYRVKYDPNSLNFIQDLNLLLISCKFPQIQQKCAQLIADVYTCFSQIFSEKGKIKSKQFMQNTLKKLQSFKADQQQIYRPQNQVQLYGLLCLLKQMLSATQVQGVGNLKSHNSLITTSMIRVKIWNNSSYGDDVQKCYQKSVPSNMTLYELLSVIGEKFKCGQHQLYLQEGNNTSIPLKMNGHTLLQLGFSNYRQFNAYKNHKIQIRKQPLKTNNSLNPLFLSIIKEVFLMFSREGKMGQQQIVNYIRSVTNSPSHSKDSRVQSLLKDYDSDHDGYLTENDLIKFYEDSCDDGQKERYVWNNLANLHYRNDLRKFNQPVGPVEEDNLFRFHVKNSQKIYELLIAFTKLKHDKIAALSKTILVRLPTTQNFSSNLLESLNFEKMDSFETSYILINVRYFLQKEQQKKTKQKNTSKHIYKHQNQQQSQQNMIKNQDKPLSPQKIKERQFNNGIQKFIESKNDIKILNLIRQLSGKQQKTEQQKVLLIVSINILRTLINFPSLNENYIKSQKYQIYDFQKIIQQTNVLNFKEQHRFFTDLAAKCFTQQDFAVYQSALALSLNDKDLKWQSWMEQGIFHQEFQVRKVTLNFLLFYSLKSSFSINFFHLNIQINPSRCEQWFLLLYFFVRYNNNIQITEILETTLNTVQTQEQQISVSQYFNPILNGNLNLIQVILAVYPEQIVKSGVKIYSLLQNIVQKTLSNDNRMLEYQLMTILNPTKLMHYLEGLIKQTKPTDKYQIKDNFVGIKNLGSTCYMNSILQQFFVLKDFRNLILRYSLKEIPAKISVNGTQIVDDFMYQLQKMYTYLNLSKKKFYFPKEFCLTIKDYDKKPINTSIQQDAHQFLNNLFDKVQKYMKEAGNLLDLQRVFQGKTICEIECKQCETKKEKIQDFYHLALEVKGSQTLNESFKKFIAPEVIEGYYCQKCEKTSQITKQTFINQAPQILIVNLQRIIFDLNTFQKVKVHSRLQFPENLQLHQFIHAQNQKLNKKYRLKGVVIHSGTSQGGHYYSLIKVDNDWYKFNDETVTKFSLTDLERQAFGGAQSTDGWGDNEFSTNAYILFYENYKEQQNIALQKEQENENMQKSEQETIFSENGIHDDQQKHIVSTQKQSTSGLSPYKSVKSIPEQSSASIFEWQVLQQNKSFYKQLQIHQQSFFDFVNQLYQSIRPHHLFQSNPPLAFYQEWQNLQHLQMFQKLFSIYMEIMRFIVTFSGLSQKTIHQTGTIIYELLTLLPESTYDLVHETIDDKTWVQVICTHNDISVREMYKVALNKILYVYIKYYGWTYNQNLEKKYHKHIQNTIKEEKQIQNDEQIVERNFKSPQKSQKEEMLLSSTKIQNQDTTYDDPVLRIMIHFIQSASSNIVTKNMFKSYHFFQFLNVSILMDSGIQNFCHKNNYLLTLLDLLMANQGPLAQKQKKRQDFPYEMAVPLVQTMVRLIYRKKNMVGLIPFKNQFIKQQDYLELTQMETQVLTSMQFYKKMMKFKYDNGLLSQIIYFMSFNDKKFSERICQLFLMGLNKLDEVDDTFALLNNIKAFLLIKDQFQSQRIEWVLGIPQFESITKLSYGLRYSNESSNMVYVSSRYFIADQKYKPALQVLHDKRSYFTNFEVSGIITLLQILNNSQEAFNYTLAIPPPSYLYYNYLTWIGEYIKKLQTEQHYGLNIDKNILAQNMRSLYQQLIQKIEKLQKPQYPVLKKIIGINKTVQIQEEISNEVFFIRKWTHETYVLDNLPQQKEKQNLSLPDEIFSIKEAKSYAKYFIQNNDIKFCDVEVPAQKAVNTLQIQTKKPLKLTLTLPHFNHQIFIEKGEIMINYPYSDFPLQGYLQVEILESQKIQQALNQQKITEPNYDANNDGYKPDAYQQDVFEGGFGGTIGGGFDNTFQIPCEVCTYFNDSKNTKCQMCETPLK